MRLATGGIALVAALPFLAGCAATRKEPPPKPFAGTRWQVVLELPLAGEQPNMRFGGGRVEGFGGGSRLEAEGGEGFVGAGAHRIGRREGGPRPGGGRAQAAPARAPRGARSRGS